MNKSYSKPSTTLQSLKLEGTFMNCSVRGKMAIEIENYETFSDFNTSNLNEYHQGSTASDWKIGFDE